MMLKIQVFMPALAKGKTEYRSAHYFFSTSYLHSIQLIAHEMHHIVTGSWHPNYDDPYRNMPVTDHYSTGRRRWVELWGGNDLLQNSAAAFGCFVVENGDC